MQIELLLPIILAPPLLIFLFRKRVAEFATRRIPSKVLVIAFPLCMAAIFCQSMFMLWSNYQASDTREKIATLLRQAQPQTAELLKRIEVNKQAIGALGSLEAAQTRGSDAVLEFQRKFAPLRKEASDISAALSSVRQDLIDTADRQSKALTERTRIRDLWLVFTSSILASLAFFLAVCIRAGKLGKSAGAEATRES